MRRYRIGLAVMAGLAVAPVGCSHLNNTEAGALGGGAIGTAAGLAIGAATGNPKTGAVVGGLAGAGIGGLAGNAADKKEAAEIRQAEAEAAAAQPGPLGLTDVVTLTQQGVSDSVIVNQMRSTGSSFQLSTGDIQYLKSQGVSDAIINEMISSRNRPATVVARPRPRGQVVVVEEPPPVVIARPHPYWCGPPVVYAPPRPALGFSYVHVGR